MKLSKVDLETVKNYMSVYFDDDDDLIEGVIMPSAKGYILSVTKRTLEELDNYPEITATFLVICLHLYDNRGMILDGEFAINEFLKQSLGMHKFYFLGGEL